MGSEDSKPEKPELDLSGADLQMTPAVNAVVGDAFALTATAVVCCVTEEIGEDGLPSKCVELSLNGLTLSSPKGLGPQKAADALYTKGE
jgi:hypothetical protein